MKTQARENAIVELPKLPDPSYSDCADAIAKFNHFSVCLFVPSNILFVRLPDQGDDMVSD